MAQQTRAQYKQLPGILDIGLRKGNDFRMLVNFNRDISASVFDAGIVDFAGADVVSFTVSGVILASGTLNLDLTDIETDLIPEGAHWYLDETISEYTRTMLAGKVLLQEPTDD